MQAYYYQNFKHLFYAVSMPACLYECHVYADTCRDQMILRDSKDLESQTAVSHSKCMQGTKYRPSGRAVRTLNHRAIFKTLYFEYLTQMYKSKYNFS